MTDRKIILKNGQVVLPDRTITADILMVGEKIAQVAPAIVMAGATVIDVTGKYILAGAIDSHTHLDLDVGVTTTVDDFYTGSCAAVAGGTTTILDFATQTKGHTLKEALVTWKQKADKRGTYCDYGFHLAITDWNAMTKKEMQEMIGYGVSSFKMYMAYKGSLQVGDGAIYEAVVESKKLGAIIGFHCENGDLIDARIEENRRSAHMHPYYHKASRPEILEIEAINRLLTIARLADAKVWIVHLSTGKGLALIQEQVNAGVEVVVETCPQYLLLDESLYGCPQDNSFEGAKYVMSPPLRHKENQVDLWKGLQVGSIDFVSTDHCAFNFKGQKELGKKDFSKIPNGVMGIEHRLSLLYTYGVCEGRLTMNELTTILAYNPAKCFGLFNKGSIEVGKDADLVVLNPHQEHTICAATQVQDADYTPYEGFAVKGKVEMVFLRGNSMLENGKVIMTKNIGKYQPRSTVNEKGNEYVKTNNSNQ